MPLSRPVERAAVSANRTRLRRRAPHSVTPRAMVESTAQRYGASRPRSWRRTVSITGLAILAVLASLTAYLTYASLWPHADPKYVATNPALRRSDLFLYPAQGTAGPRAFVFFFGNDIGFWHAHRQVAADLAAHGYAVAGFDMKPLLEQLPERDDQRDSAYLARIGPLIVSAREELSDGADTPLILAGHSLGAEVALWTAAHARLPHPAGVLALSPGSRSHLRVAMSDMLGTAEPTGPGSFAVASEVAAVVNDAPQRVAIVRGQRDGLQFADSAILLAGGVATRRFIVPFAGHSLNGVTVAPVVIRRSLLWLTERP